jgi:hypothetical protein
MAPRVSTKTLVDRRRRADGDEDDESVTGMDDSQSDMSVASDLDDTVDTMDPDADAAESTDTEPDGARVKKPKKDKTPSSADDSDQTRQESVAGESNRADVSAVAAGAPIVSSASILSKRGETVADRRRREHDDYKKKRDTDPTFIPNRGNFFMHDARTSDQRGFSSYGRGRGGRGRGIPQTPSRYV